METIAARTGSALSRQNMPTPCAELRSRDARLHFAYLRHHVLQILVRHAGTPRPPSNREGVVQGLTVRAGQPFTPTVETIAA